MNLLLIGPPSSGKGTQAEKLAEKFQLAYVNMGGIFRKMKNEETPLAHKVREYYGKGVWVPDEIVIQVINEYLRGLGRLDGVVFDGFPRVLNQGIYFDQYLNEKGQKIDLVIYLSLPEEETRKRISNRRACEKCDQVYNLLTKRPKTEGICDLCQGKLIVRSDETPEAIETRLKEFRTKTVPLIEYYRKRGLLEEVDGNRPIEVIFGDLLQRIKKRGLA